MHNVKVEWGNYYQVHYSQRLKSGVIEIPFTICYETYENITLYLNETFNLQLFEDIHFLTLSYLHELGHLSTREMFSDKVKERPKSGNLVEYRQHPEEFAADLWCMIALDSNRECILKWQEKLLLAYEDITDEDLDNFLTDC